MSERTYEGRPIPGTRSGGWQWWVHNCVAHPLLVLCPPIGRFLHDATAP